MLLRKVSTKTLPIKLDLKWLTRYGKGNLAKLNMVLQAWKSNGNQNSGRMPGLEKYSQDQLFFLAYTQGWCALRSKSYKLQPHMEERIRYVKFLNIPCFHWCKKLFSECLAPYKTLQSSRQRGNAHRRVLWIRPINAPFGRLYIFHYRYYSNPFLIKNSLICTFFITFWSLLHIFAITLFFFSF